MTKPKTIRQAIHDIRMQKREFRESSFSRVDLKKMGFTNDEIEKLSSVNWKDEVRYEKIYIIGYLDAKRIIQDNKDLDSQGKLF